VRGSLASMAPRSEMAPQVGFGTAGSERRGDALPDRQTWEPIRRMRIGSPPDDFRNWLIREAALVGDVCVAHLA
jgi:hypothetical protein